MGAGSTEATPPVQRQTTPTPSSVAADESQSGDGDTANSAERVQSPAPLASAPLQNETIPKQIHLPEGGNDLGKGAVSPLSAGVDSLKSATPPLPLEGVVKPDSSPATPVPGQLSTVLSRLKKRVVDTAWQGTESKVGLDNYN